MVNFKKEWDGLFLEIMESYVLSGENVDGKTVLMTNGNVYLHSVRLYCGTKSIIDNVLIWSSNITCILKYLECVCCIFQK